METFPQTVLWDKSSSQERDHGLRAVRMADGTDHTQTYYTEAAISFTVTHNLLTPAELDTVTSFLVANVGVDFTLVEPLSGISYTGKQVGTERIAYAGDVHNRMTWRFSGRAL